MTTGTLIDVGDVLDCSKVKGLPLVTGFFATLSDEQKRAALEYRGPENHGDKEFRIKRERCGDD